MIHMKQFMLAVSVMFSMAVLSGNAMALGLEYYGVEVTINDDLSVHNNVVLKFDSPVNHLDYSLDFSIDNLDYNADFDFADCVVKDKTISCDFIGMTSENNKITFDFDTRNVIRKVGEDNYRFIVNYGIPLPIEASFVLIRLPQNNILAGEGNESYAPLSGGTLTDGKRIMVFWEEEALETGENLQFSILFTRPAANTDFMGFLVFLAGIIAIISIVTALVYMKKIRRSKVAVVKSVMNKDEKKIIDVLNDNKGKAGQKILVRETDFSKAKVSRIVKNLKERGVVNTEPISGRENRVMLRIGEDKEKPK